MAQIINVGGKILLAGMHWIDPESERPSAQPAVSFLAKFSKPKTAAGTPVTERALVAAKKASFAAGSTRNAWGYLTVLEKRAMRKVPRFGKAYALAEMFSAVPDLAVCAILIAQIPGEEEFVMCTSINGHPAPGNFDVIVPASQVEQTLRQWDSQLRVVTTSAPALYGTWTGVAHNLTLEKLTQTAAAVRPIRAVGMDTRQVAVLAVLVGGSVVAYMAWEDHQREERIKNAQASARKNNPAAVYEKALAEQWSAQTWGSPARVRVLQDQVRKVREFVGGFKISEPAVCSVATGVCTFSYKKGDDSSATFVDFQEDIQGQFVVTSFGQDGRTVQVSMTVKNMPTAKVPSVDSLADEAKSPLLFWPIIQQLQPTQKVSGGLKNNYTVFPASLGINESSVPALVRSVGVEVTYPLWDVKLIPSAGGVFANAINWKTLTAGGGTVTLAGEMYAKKTNP